MNETNEPIEDEPTYTAMWLRTRQRHNIGDKLAVETDTSRRIATVIAHKPGWIMVAYAL